MLDLGLDQAAMSAPRHVFLRLLLSFFLSFFFFGGRLLVYLEELKISKIFLGQPSVRVFVPAFQLPLKKKDRKNQIFYFAAPILKSLL